MKLRTLFTFLALTLFLVSCKSSSPIVTSKKEAQKLGIYQAPEKRITSRTTQKKEDKIDLEIQQKSNRDIIKDPENTDYSAENYEVNDYLSEQLIHRATQFLGVNYKTGGTSENGMDCSGLIIATFNDYNIKLPRTSNEMSRIGQKIDLSKAKKGDLIFFKTNGKSVINHVGMIIEINEDELKFIHSSTQKGVIISSAKEGYYSRTLAQINRVTN